MLEALPRPAMLFFMPASSTLHPRLDDSHGLPAALSALIRTTRSASMDARRVGVVAFLLLLATSAHAASPLYSTNELGSLILLSTYGDLNDDGDTDVRDVVLLNNHLRGTQLLASGLESRADLNQDNLLTAADRTALVTVIVQRSTRGDDDPDSDELPNAEEVRLGTNPFEADTDHDGSLDGWEAAEGTDPLNPESQMSITVVASPGITVLHPLIQDTDTSAPGPVVALPPVQILHPLIQDTDLNGPGPVVARPPVQVLSPALQDEEEAGAITVARPSVFILHPLIQDTDTNSTGTFVARPPTSVLVPTP